MSRPHPALTLYLVTDTTLCGGTPQAVADTVRAAVRGGVTLVQVRDPHADDAEFLAIARAVGAALADTDVPFVLNDRVHLVAAAGAHGAHIGQGDLPPAEARRRLGPDALLGLSVHDQAELDAARRLPAGTVDHLGLGPLRATASKPDHGPVRTLEHLESLVTASPWPSVVIGGVKAADAADLRAIGAAGMAVVSAVCGQSDPAAAAAHLLHAWRAAPEHTPTRDALGDPAQPTDRTDRTDTAEETTP